MRGIRDALGAKYDTVVFIFIEYRLKAT